jgi:hypothetical protein
MIRFHKLKFEICRDLQFALCNLQSAIFKRAPNFSPLLLGEGLGVRAIGLNDNITMRSSTSPLTLTLSQRERGLRDLQFAFCNLQFAIAIFSIGLFVFLYSPAPLAAQSRTDRSLGDELLKNLKDQSKKEIERDFFSPLDKNGNERRQTRAAEGNADLDERLKLELGAAAEKENDNPLLNIANNMFQVRLRMKQSNVGPATLGMQKQIVADLDQLIEQVRKSAGQCQSSSANSQGQPKQNPSDSSAKSGAKPGQKTGGKPAAAGAKNSSDGQTRKPDVEEIRTMMNNLWGELPPSVQEQMLQAPIEDFVPKYQNLIEDYFRDLSNEKKSRE